MVYTRCRVGHARLNRWYLLKGEEPQKCQYCTTPLSVKRIFSFALIQHIRDVSM